jgi:hypothetical protein
MTHWTRILAGSLLAASLLAGCGGAEGCDEFAEHLADVVAKEKGSALDDDMRAKMIKKTADSCAADPPSPETLECAKTADSTEAMKACEKKPDEG